MDYSSSDRSTTRFITSIKSIISTTAISHGGTAFFGTFKDANELAPRCDFKNGREQDLGRNKAFEELVTNSFDAGALNVNVILPSDPTAKNASIIVVDDGEGMNALGLEELWQIGATQKRLRGDLPRGRSQIGKFGIGKLATYVLANRLTYISKSGRKYYATSMDYTRLDSAAKMGVVAQEPIKLEVRELTATEAKTSVEPWTSSLAFQKNGKYLSSENKRRNLGHSQFCRL